MINRDNYRAVRSYLAYQAEVLQFAPLTVAWKKFCLNHLLRWADEVPFAETQQIRPVFPRYLLTVERADEMHRGRDNVRLSPQGLARTCGEARRLFEWLRLTQPKQYKSITPGWIATIRPVKIPKESRKEHQAVTLQMVRELVEVPGDSLALKRDKAAAAFLYLSGARATAFCTLSLDCVDIASRTVKQLPSMGVKTKNSTAAVTSLLEIPDLLDVAADWDSYVRAHLPGSAPWYTVIKVVNGEPRLDDSPPGNYRARMLRKNLRKLFDATTVSYMSPHKFRHGHAVYALKLAEDVGDLKAVSQNLMHSSIGVTDSIYAVLSDSDIQARISGLGKGTQNTSTPDANGNLDQTEMAAMLRQMLKSIEGKG